MHNLNLFFFNKIILKVFNKIILLLFFKKILNKQIADISEYMHLSKEISVSRAVIKNTVLKKKLWNSKKEKKLMIIVNITQIIFII